jgi:hypothetical protein
LTEFPKLETQIRRIPGGCWDPRQRIITWTLQSRHLIQPDGCAHAVDIGLLDGRKGMEQDARAYRAFVGQALPILVELAVNHGGLEVKNGGPGDLLHWQVKPRG